MRTGLACAMAFVALFGPRAAAAEASASASAPGGGGLSAVSVSVDVAAKELRYASCPTSPCPVVATGPSVPIATGDSPLNAATVTATVVKLGGGRHLVRVRVPLTTDTGPESPAWEALITSGGAPLFTGRTGWTRGEPGERSGVEIRLLDEDDHSVVVVGDIREDFRICGDDATLLDPRGLDPHTLVFHGATVQRLDAKRRAAAIPITATPRGGPAEPALTPLLAATEATSGAAAALTDGDVDTAWSEGRPGRGQGEFVLLRTPFDVPITRFSVTVTPAHPRPETVAPETFFLATNAGTYEITLPDDATSHPGQAYDLTLPSPVQTSCVALVLDDAFTRGKTHPEVSVAELTAYSTFDHAGATLGDVAAVLGGSDPRGEAAAALLERAGPPGILAMSAAYASLDPAGRALALNVAASAASCAGSGKLLVGALTDPDEVVRGKAAAKLAEPSCGREALPALIDGLRADGARGKVAPFVALVGRGEAIGPLIDALGAGSPEERATVRAAVAYAAREAHAEDLAARLSTTRSPDANLELLRALHRRLGDIRGPAGAAVGALLGGKPDDAVRYRLVDVVGWLAVTGDDVSAQRLADFAVHDPSQDVRAAAVELFALASNAETVAAHALADPEPRVREAALHAIGARHQSRQIPTITRLLAHDPWTFVRVAAAESLATLPESASADRSLADALEQVSPRVRQRSIVALAARGAHAYTGAIRDRLMSTKEEPMVRSAAARALGLLCDARASDSLAELAVAGATSSDPAEVALGLVATTALGKLHPADLATRFAPLAAKSARPDARAAADRALADPIHCPPPPTGR